jgi:hypothetical protein
VPLRIDVHKTKYEEIKRIKMSEYQKFKKHQHGGRVWKCRCDCGRIEHVCQDWLISGHITQCSVCEEQSQKTFACKSDN